MKINNELAQLMPGIIFALVLFSVSLLPSFLNIILPKYYGGDPNYSIEKYEMLRKESTEKFRQRLPEFSEKNLLFELPPKTIDFRIQFIYFLIIPFQVFWGLSWSIYAFINRTHFRSKNIVWLTYGIYGICLMLYFRFLLWVGSAMQNF